VSTPTDTLTFSGRYADFRRTATVVGEDPHVLPPELELQALWFAGAFGREFITTGGLPVKVVQFGEWNRSAGPDFLHAAVDIGGTVHTGPVELDTHPRDWEAHGHATSRAFNEVVLHVAFSGASRSHFCRSCEGREIPSVVIAPEQLDEALDRPVAGRAASHPGRCAFPLSKLPAGRLHDLLGEAARFRLARKGAQLCLLEESHGFEEALWQSLSRALGYGPNKLSMTLLAQRIPRRLLSGQRTNSTREALLFGIAGFLSADLHERCPVDSRRYLTGLWNDWWKLRSSHEPAPRRELPWVFSGLRPQNHPHRRLGALVAISADWRRISTPARKFTPARCHTLLERLTSLEHPFWSSHYTLTAKAAARPVALFGKARVHEFLANYYLPRWFREDRAAAEGVYHGLPAGVTPDAVRRAATRLLGDREDRRQFLRKLWQQQALLQIYHDFCLQDSSDCETCPFPEQLTGW
jgi:hypothetical protein